MKTKLSPLVIGREYMVRGKVVTLCGYNSTKDRCFIEYRDGKVKTVGRSQIDHLLGRPGGPVRISPLFHCKPCPFCGGQATMYSDNGEWYVGCSEFSCYGFWENNVSVWNRGQAVRRWNKRTTQI